jgi:tetratricopeptide (TPR) repeat protein
LQSFAAAESASRHPREVAERIAETFEVQGQYAQASAYWDRVVAATPDKASRSLALNSSCWSRARAGVELDRALKDCDTSLQLQPGIASALDSRGLVHLRKGDPAKALADYDAALAHAPNAATSLYGRGLAEARLGESDKSHADLAQARWLDPTIDKLFEGWGLRSNSGS